MIRLQPFLKFHTSTHSPIPILALLLAILLTCTELKEKEKVSEGSVKDETDHAVTEEPLRVAPLQTSNVDRETSSRISSQATSDESSTINRSQASTSVVSRPRAATVGTLHSSKELMEKHGSSKSSSLQQNLDKIMASLDTRRKSAGRPDDMTVRNLNIVT